MATKLIKLEDNTLVEVEVSEDQARPIARSAAKEIAATFEKIQPLLVRISQPIAKAWKEIDKDMNIEQAEIQLGLSFEGEGNIYVTKTKAGANLIVKLVLKPKV